MISLDYQSKDPIYLQIKNRIAELTVLGVYPPGTQLPSVRSLAQELGTNPNTIQKAYQELENAGITYSVSGKGSFIAPGDAARTLLLQRAEQSVRQAVQTALAAGASREQLLHWIDQACEGGNLHDRG